METQETWKSKKMWILQKKITIQLLNVKVLIEVKYQLEIWTDCGKNDQWPETGHKACEINIEPKEETRHRKGKVSQNEWENYSMNKQVNNMEEKVSKEIEILKEKNDRLEITTPMSQIKKT